jgi:hypothetical protein
MTFCISTYFCGVTGDTGDIRTHETHWEGHYKERLHRRSGHLSSFKEAIRSL